MTISEGFAAAAGVCAPAIRNALSALSEEYKRQTTELRLRSNCPVVLTGSYGSTFITPQGNVTQDIAAGLFATAATVADTFNRLCGYSIYSHHDSIVNGYITMPGGHRAGVSGTAVTSPGEGIHSIRDVCCINIRIAREIHGAADEVMRHLFRNGLQSVILAGAPGSGKTTVLRDLARQLSRVGEKSCKVTVIDGRGELACVRDGVRFFDVGVNTDVLDAYPKGEGISMAIRTMSPDIIICDEVSREDELQAIEQGVNAGVRFALSVHASSYEELLERRQIDRLLDTYSFQKLILLKSAVGRCEIQAIYDAEEIRDEICRHRLGGSFAVHGGNGGGKAVSQPFSHIG